MSGFLRKFRARGLARILIKTDPEAIFIEETEANFRIGWKEGLPPHRALAMRSC
jgi:hypothetical protein